MRMSVLLSSGEDGKSESPERIIGLTHACRFFSLSASLKNFRPPLHGVRHCWCPTQNNARYCPCGRPERLRVTKISAAPSNVCLSFSLLQFGSSAPLWRTYKPFSFSSPSLPYHTAYWVISPKPYSRRRMSSSFRLRF
jgi:hypothetical protein